MVGGALFGGGWGCMKFFGVSGDGWDGWGIILSGWR